MTITKKAISSTTSATYDTFSDLVDAAAVSGETVVIAETLTVTASKAVPAGVNFMFVNAGKLSINAGATVSNMPAPLNDPTWQIYDGDGAVTMASGRTINVQWFGAVGDGVADDTAAINSARVAACGYTDGARHVANARLYFPQGQYLCSGSLNYTGATGMIWFGDGMGSKIICAAAGKAGIDMTYSNRCELRDLYIIGAEGASAPKCLILQARDSSQASSGWHLVSNVQIEGPVDGNNGVFQASLWNMNSEVNSYYDLRAYARNPGAYAIAVSGKNDISVSSDFQTIENPGTNGGSCTDISFYGGQAVENQGYTGANSAFPIYLHNCRNVNFYGMYISTSGDAEVKCLSDGAGANVDIINFVNNRFEHGASNNKYVILIDPASTLSVVIGQIVGNMLCASDAVVKMDAGTGVGLNLGIIGGNNFNLTPTYMLDLQGPISGGLVDCANCKIKAYRANGGKYYNLRNLSDATITNNPVGAQYTTSGDYEDTNQFTSGIQVIGQVGARSLGYSDKTAIMDLTSTGQLKYTEPQSGGEPTEVSNRVSKLDFEMAYKGDVAISQDMKRYPIRVSSPTDTDTYRGIVATDDQGNPQNAVAALLFKENGSAGAAGVVIATGDASGIYERLFVDSLGVARFTENVNLASGKVLKINDVQVTPALTGTAAPASTPGIVGQMYVDTSAKKVYVATGTSSSTDWTAVN